MLAGLIAVQRQKEDLEDLLELPIRSEVELDCAQTFYRAWSQVTNRLLLELFPEHQRVLASEDFRDLPGEEFALAVDRLERYATSDFAVLLDVEDVLSETLST